MAFQKTYGVRIIQSSLKYMKDPTRGLRAVATYEGTPKAIQQLALIQGKNITWETDDSNKPLWRLTVSTPDNTDLQTVWEIHPQALHKSLYEHPRSLPPSMHGIGDVSDYDLRVIRNYMKGPESAIVPGIGVASPNDLHSTTAEDLLYRQRHEQTSYYLPRYILRSRMIGSDQGFPSVMVTPDNAGLIFLQADILLGGVFDLKIAAPVQKFMKTVQPETDPTGNSTWGWMMQAPTLTGLPAGKFEYRQEFWLGLWMKYGYDLAVP